MQTRSSEIRLQLFKDFFRSWTNWETNKKMINGQPLQRRLISGPKITRFTEESELSLIQVKKRQKTSLYNIIIIIEFLESCELFSLIWVKVVNPFMNSRNDYCIRIVRIRCYSGPHFPAFSPNDADQNNSEYGHFSHSESLYLWLKKLIKQVSPK